MNSFRLVRSIHPCHTSYDQLVPIVQRIISLSYGLTQVQEKENGSFVTSLPLTIAERCNDDVRSNQHVEIDGIYD